MEDNRIKIIKNALKLLRETDSEKLFLFFNTLKEVEWFLRSAIPGKQTVVLVIPETLDLSKIGIRNYKKKFIKIFGNQTRVSRIKYALLQGVLRGVINQDSRVICVLGPTGKGRLDTVTINDLAYSWKEEFPFEVHLFIKNKAFHTAMTFIDIAIDIGTFGREGKPVGTIFTIGDEKNVMNKSHQAVFNPFRGYLNREKMITSPEVVESLKEFTSLDGAIIISANGIVKAAGRILHAGGSRSKSLRGLGSRHRAALGITRTTNAISVVVSEGTGKVTVCERGKIVATFEPLITRRKMPKKDKRKQKV
jgi:DNA integrity scanning protein DisA with diadenylate cyclase activity